MLTSPRISDEHEAGPSPHSRMALVDPVETQQLHSERGKEHNPDGIQQFRTCEGMPQTCIGPRSSTGRSCGTNTLLFGAPTSSYKSHESDDDDDDMEEMPFAMVGDRDRVHRERNDTSSPNLALSQQQELQDRYDSSDEDEYAEPIQGEEDFQLYAAGMLFLLGCFLYFPWIFGATCFLKARSRKARCLALMSMVMAIVVFIVVMWFLFHARVRHLQAKDHS